MRKPEQHPTKNYSLYYFVGLLGLTFFFALIGAGPLAIISALALVGLFVWVLIDNYIRGGPAPGGQDSPPP